MPLVRPPRRRSAACTSGASLQCPFVDPQAFTHPAKTHLLIERQCGVVVNGGVDQHSLHSPPTEPLQRIENQGPAKTSALVSGVHGQSLQKALLAVATADRVRAQRFASSACSKPRCGGAHVTECLGFQAPRLGERSDVDVAGCCVLTWHQPLCRRDGCRRCAVTAQRVTWVGVFQEHQFLDGLETSGLDAKCSGCRECSGAHGGVAELQQSICPVLQVAKGGKPSLVVEHQLGSLGLERPVLHPARDVVAVQDEWRRGAAAGGDGASARRAVQGPTTHCLDGSCSLTARNFAAAALPIASPP